MKLPFNCLCRVMVYFIHFYLLWTNSYLKCFFFGVFLLHCFICKASIDISHTVFQTWMCVMVAPTYRTGMFVSSRIGTFGSSVHRIYSDTVLLRSYHLGCMQTTVQILFSWIAMSTGECTFRCANRTAMAALAIRKQASYEELAKLFAEHFLPLHQAAAVPLHRTA